MLAVGGGWLVPGDRPEQALLFRSGQQSGDEAAAAAELVGELEDALRSADRRAVTALAAPNDRAARAELEALLANVRSLRIDRISMRYVDGSELQLTPVQARRHGSTAWVSDVQLTWRFRGADRTTSSVEVPVVMAWRGERAVFETARITDGYRVPLWFLDRVAVRRTPRTLVLGAEADTVARLHEQALAAVATVRETLPRWRRPLVVEAPAAATEFEAASGMPADDARAIAAVTTTTDGSALRRTPVHIYLNPDVYGPLGPEGQQIVLSHEAAHVALEAATASMPMWLSEGIADYVALVDSEVPVRVLAAQVRALVREDGAPKQLPGAAEFDGGNEDIGAWYEAAWLAARLIAERHGEGALLDFYRMVEADGATGRAFEEVLGTTERQFVREWRASLSELAG